MVFNRRGKDSSEEPRDCDNWIKEYMRYVEFTEPPLPFHKWTAVGCIASALQRRVYLKWGMESIYPNLYIVLLGAAAQTRKSTALKIGEDLVKQIQIPTIGQDNSPEAIIRYIKESVDVFEDNGSMQTQSSVTCFASELAVFLGQQKGDFQAYLTDWWDSPEDWKRTTKHQGIDDIHGMCFTLIGAMAPDWIPHVFTPESIGGGFTSRIVFVPASRKAKIITNPNKCPPPNGKRDRLIADLHRIRHMAGAFTLSTDAEDFYEDWYYKDDSAMQEGIFAVPDRAFHTYCGRRSVILRKLSICLAAADSSEMVIQVDHMKQALAMLTEIEALLPGTFAMVGRSSHARPLSLIQNAIQAKGKVLRSVLLGELYQDITSSDLDEVETMLIGMKRIKATRLTEDGDTEYKWVG